MNDVIQSMQSKGINFMSPLKIDSEERTGEEWNISELIESKVVKQPKSYISYQDNKGNTSIRFINYKAWNLDNLESTTSEQDGIENRRYSVSEFIEKLDLESEIKYYEEKLNWIDTEYNNIMTHGWPAIREKEIYFYRELSRLKNPKKDKNLSEERIDIQKPIINQPKIKEEVDKKDIKEIQNNITITEEEQWERNDELLLESYEEEDENDNDAEQYNDFINSLDDVGLHNLENAMEAMEVDSSGAKKRRYGESSVKNEGEFERPSRASGKWPPEK